MTEPQSRQPHTIGMITPDNRNPFFAEITRAVEDINYRNGYTTILCNTDDDLAREGLYIDLLIEKQVDGVLFVASGDNQESIHHLLDRKIPVVAIDRELDNLDIDTILVDNYQGGYIATKYLIELGHQRIGCIGGPSFVRPSGGRIAGYHKAVDEAGLGIDPLLLFRGDYGYGSAREALQLFLHLDQPPSAIFACNDIMAIGAMGLAQQMGIKVPDQLSIIGFDNIQLSTIIVPALTTIAQPKRAIGETAVNTLLARIENPDISPRRQLLPTSLIIRDSTAPASQQALALNQTTAGNPD